MAFPYFILGHVCDLMIISQSNVFAACFPVFFCTLLGSVTDAPDIWYVLCWLLLIELPALLVSLTEVVAA